MTAIVGVEAAGFPSRAGSVADTPLVVGLVDGAVQKMVARGPTDRCGDRFTVGDWPGQVLQKRAGS